MKQHKIPIIPLSQPRKLRQGDEKVASSIISQITLIRLDLNGHEEEVPCLVTPLGTFDVILGMPWMELHDPSASFKRRLLTFESDYCMTHCLAEHKPVTVHSQRRGAHQNGPKITDADIAEVSAFAFAKLGKKAENQVTALWPKDFEQLLRDGQNTLPNVPGLTADVAALSPEDYEKFFNKMRKPTMSMEELRRLVPPEYHKWIEVWNPRKANQLPPHRSINHAIDLHPGSTPPAKRAYGMSRDQAAVVKEYIDEMLGKGYIRPSTSPYAAPVLIVKKPDGGLRICVDYRALNAVTIKNRNAPPLIRETLAKLCAARIYSKFDIIAAFNEIRIKEGHEEKTAFLTRYGLFEYVVMPFGLCNAPGTFQTFINEVLREHLDVFCTAYLNDILIYSGTKEEHVQHVRKVLQKLQTAGLFLDINKCEFHTTEVRYLGLIITTQGLKMEPQKINAIVTWQPPRGLRDVQAFLGFANFYRRFINNYSKLAAPLSNLTRSEKKKDFQYPWKVGSPEDLAFEGLKKAFTTAPVLAHFDPDKETWVESDASDYVVAAVLSQKDEQGELKPVAYMSKKMSPQECNYEIYDKELLAIIRAFEEWHPELAGTPVEEPINVLTDHKNLEYFMSSKQLNRRQARWAEFLSEFNFRITYRPGKQGTKPDSLTRRAGDLPDSYNDARNQHQHQTILKPAHLGKGVRTAVSLSAALLDETEHAISYLTSMIYDLSEQVGFDDEESQEESSLEGLGEPAKESCEELAVLPIAEASDILEEVKRAYNIDDVTQRLKEAKTSQQRKIPQDLVKANIRIELKDCEVIDDLLYVNRRLYVPNVPTLHTAIIRQIHESPPGGHAGRASTYERVSRHYYWPRMTNTVAQYVKSCHTCKRSKTYRDGKQGLLKPLPIPERYWEDISVDFITPLPICQRFGRAYQHIMTVVDRLSKKKKFVALDSLEVEAIVQAFIEWIWREEGYPKSIVSNRGTQFTAHFWQRLCDRIGTKPKLSTSFHPETDRQSENANAALKQYLRAYVNHNQDNWVDFLPIAEFESNSDINASSGVPPFLATKGYLPRSGLEPPLPWDKLSTQKKKRDIRAADDFVSRVNSIREQLRDQLKWSQALQTEQANRHRLPAPQFKVGDYVMLDARNIKTARPNKSLDHKNIGPYKITRAINNMAYELELPSSLKGLHPVFHPWLLHLDNSDPLPGQLEPPPPPVEVDEEGSTWSIEEILDSKIDKRTKDPITGLRGLLMYYIRYTGYESKPSWQPFTDAAGCTDLVADFHHTYPNKPGPHQTFKTPEDWEPLLSALLYDCVDAEDPE